MPTTRKRLIASTAAAIAASAVLAAVGCGSDTDSETEATSRAAPAPSEFPAPGEDGLEGLLDSLPAAKLVVLPAGQVFVPGSNRVGFGAFTIAGDEVSDAAVALYAAHGSDGRARGPFPARIESLETEPEFAAKTTANDDHSAHVVYASEIRLSRPGEWRMVAAVREDGKVTATRLPSVDVREDDPIPGPGDPAPRVHTPTVADVESVAEIDTRVPHSTLHEHDLAEVLGSKPVVLVFATPALCQSRVCGPVVDVTEQVKHDHGDEVAFIYSEIYEGNDPNGALREPVRAFNLPTEPWLFVIDRDGKVETRIEGAFSVAELEVAVERVSP